MPEEIRRFKALSPGRIYNPIRPEKKIENRAAFGGKETESLIMAGLQGTIYDRRPRLTEEQVTS